jgi:hypothetical protein
VRNLVKVSALSAAVLALGLGLGFLWLKHAPRRTPASQPPLAWLDAVPLMSLRTAFNAHREEARILVLLSPT